MIRPKQIYIEATNRCNLKCKGCPSVSNETFPIGDMDLGFFKSIVDRINWDCTIIPFMNGEAFLHPKYLEMIEYLNEKEKRFYFTTNLTIMRKDVLREAMKKDSGCYQIIVSLDALFGTGNVAKTRPGSDEELIKKNLYELLALKRETKSKVEITLKLCRRGQDWGEIEKFVQFWLSDSDIDHIVVGNIFTGSNEEPMRTEPCRNIDNNFMIVRWNGRLIPCTLNTRMANDLAMSYGVLNRTEDLIEKYNNSIISKMRKDQDEGRYNEVCAHCSFAYTGVGFHGVVNFRGSDETYWFQQDYYNAFFSKNKNWKPDAYYLREKEV
jgi:hypothetical protein